jgi:hypothetical protein
MECENWRARHALSRGAANLRESWNGWRAKTREKKHKKTKQPLAGNVARREPRRQPRCGVHTSLRYTSAGNRPASFVPATPPVARPPAAAEPPPPGRDDVREADGINCGAEMASTSAFLTAPALDGRTPASVTAIDLPRLAQLVNVTVEELIGGLQRGAGEGALVASARVVSRSEAVAFAPKSAGEAVVADTALLSVASRPGVLDTAQVPKVLVELAGAPVIGHVLNQLHAGGVRRAIIVLGARACITSPSMPREPRAPPHASGALWTWSPRRGAAATGVICHHILLVIASLCAGTCALACAGVCCRVCMPRRDAHP